jgi:hypothetical protein
MSYDNIERLENRINELAAKCEAYDESFVVLQQTLLEVSHAQQNGSDWYTKGSSGLYQQVSMWIGKGQEAINRIKELP